MKEKKQKKDYTVIGKNKLDLKKNNQWECKENEFLKRSLIVMFHRLITRKEY